MTKEQLLVEVEDLLKTMPSKESLRHNTPENLDWLGRATALLRQWNLEMGVSARQYVEKMHTTGREGFLVINNLLSLIQQAKHDLRMQTAGPVSISVRHGMVFDYFDEIRKIIDLA